LHPAEFGSFVAIVNRPDTAGRWRLALVGCGRRDAPGVVDFDRIRQLKQFLLGGFRRRERSLSSWLHDRHADGVGGASLAFTASGHVMPP
jgi:hypothetical protein